MNQHQGSEEVPGGSETILVVEDEELLLELVQSLLESKGYTVITTRDGETAVELYKRHRESIALVLTDLGLPKLGGWEATQMMKALDPNLPVIVATGYLDTIEREEMLKRGVTEFVQKPYLAHEITRKVREMLDSRRNPQQ